MINKIFYPKKMKPALSKIRRTVIVVVSILLLSGGVGCTVKAILNGKAIASTNLLQNEDLLALKKEAKSDDVKKVEYEKVITELSGRYRHQREEQHLLIMGSVIFFLIGSVLLKVVKNTKPE